MAIGVQLRPSTDSGNGITIGSDRGLRLVTTAGRGGTLPYSIDNSWSSPAAATSYYYSFPSFTVSNYAPASGLALVWPFVVTRDARLTALSAQILSAAGSGYYHATFASDPANGLPAAKIADVANVSTAAAAVAAASMLTTTPVYTANTLYWMCSWINGGTPTISHRNFTGSPATPLRLLTAPTLVTQFTGSWGSLPETASGWAARTTAPSTLAITTATVPNGYAPQLWMGLLNV